MTRAAVAWNNAKYGARRADRFLKLIGAITAAYGGTQWPLTAAKAATGFRHMQQRLEESEQLFFDTIHGKEQAVATLPRL